MIASLPMYAFPRTEAAEARLWSGIRDRLRDAGIDAPDSLTPAPDDLRAHWTDPGLILSQTCGRPYKDHLHGQVRLVGTPDYGLEDCPPGHYRSLVIARADDRRGNLMAFAGSRFAFNDAGSQSGWAALAAEAPEVLRGPRHRTGSHRASIRAVREERADFAAIDAVTFRIVSATGETQDLDVIHATAPRPGLPLITNATQDTAPVFAAVAEAIAALSPTDRDTLGLRGLIPIPAEAYLALPDPWAFVGFPGTAPP
jgi:ABC-type phosphate/phosphonate transport system substrate-binding protein